MKPISLTTRNSRKFPLIDCYYQAITLGRCRGQCAKTDTPSFRNISRQYFQNDARRDFIGEAFFFAVIVATVAVSLLNTASDLTELCRAFGQL